jgi:hypothetical protein
MIAGAVLISADGWAEGLLVALTGLFLNAWSVGQRTRNGGDIDLLSTESLTDPESIVVLGGTGAMWAIFVAVRYWNRAR